jgi:membrane associated rhomboid family serine protease
VGVLAAQPEVQAMAGLSAVLHGLLAAGAVTEARRGRVLGAVFLALLAVKLVVDLLGGVPAARIVLGRPIAAEAHLFGALAGALCALRLPAPPLRRLPG